MPDTPAEIRTQTGAGARTPPDIEWSGSEGDRNRFSLGPSRVPRRTVRYVANDDGTPVAEETNALLRELLVVMQDIQDINRAALAILELEVQ